MYVATARDDDEADRLYAIKLIHESLAVQQVFVDMLLSEAEMARNLVHPNIVGICDSGKIDDRHFVAMPYVEGGTLSELARRSGGLCPTGVAARVMIDVLRGLHAAHALADDDGNSLGLVHRDISPGNVLIGTDGIARVIDFGVAKATARITRTMPGIVKGKFAYMAPEQAMSGTIDCRADVFSAGVVLWTALTGEPLFAEDNDACTLKNLLQAPIPRPSEIRSDLPECFDEICLRALERDPAKRFQSASEFAEKLFTVAKRCGCVASAQEVSDRVTEAFAQRIARRREFVTKMLSGEPSNKGLNRAMMNSEPIASVSTSVTPVGPTTLYRSERTPSAITKIEVLANSSLSAVSLPGVAQSARSRKAKTTGTIAIVAFATAAILAAVFLLLLSNGKAAASSVDIDSSAVPEALTAAD